MNISFVVATRWAALFTPSTPRTRPPPPVSLARRPPLALVGYSPARLSWTLDLDDLERKAEESGAKVLLLSHMRGKVRRYTTAVPPV